MYRRALAPIGVFILAIASLAPADTSFAAGGDGGWEKVVFRDGVGKSDHMGAPAAGVATELQFLQQRYDLDPAEAAMRIQREVEIQALLDEVVKNEVQRAWAGASIAHEDGGTVMMFVASAEAVAELEAADLPPYATIVRVDHSLDDLKEERDEVERQLVASNSPDDLSGNFSSVIDVRNNSIRYSAQEGEPVLAALQRRRCRV